MQSREIRRTFLDFFAQKTHKIVASAPIVTRNDPTLMFTNAGMNQFKDFFLGNQTPENPRIADTQKCLRVSGKHNDLEEVGIDSYHHTMFEMLGNWSIGDYFKEEAINWAWELLVEVYGIDKERLYVSVFAGDAAEGLGKDTEAADFWKKWIPEDRILYFDKKDNFWEMGDTGPCGPCSEIHVDLRDDADRQKVDGSALVNRDNPLVVEIWNLVFIQFNRKADGSLEELPAKHVDTGMGFERLCMVLQQKKSNYDTDVFSPLIKEIEAASGKKYTFSYKAEDKSDIAMRVVADHLRAVAFTIADGELPGNTGAGYVIRRILRRSIRYYYSFLGIQEPFIYKLVAVLAAQMEEAFPELKAQEAQVARVIQAEERSFLHTLENGLQRFDNLELSDGLINGQQAFELYDTFGFPIDLTRLLASEKGWQVDEPAFEKALQAQKERSRKDAKKEVEDWVVLTDNNNSSFLGYDTLTVPDAKVVKYRMVASKGKQHYQLVLDRTPFYAESGGQAGDKGTLSFGNESLAVLDTQKENELTIHVVNSLPQNLGLPVLAAVDAKLREGTSQNHSAAHLMHAALHQVLGDHALQKGQDVDDRRLRFDFAHFQKVDEAELARIEQIVNEKIRANIMRTEDRAVPIEEAKEAGAMMLFGEKYGEFVRMITFDPGFSRELCGGTHVASTGEIGLFKIISESAVAAGIRRIEAITAKTAEEYIKSELGQLNEIRQLLKNAAEPVRMIRELQDDNRKLRKEIEALLAKQAAAMKDELVKKAERRDGYTLIRAVVPINDSNALKNLAQQIDHELKEVVIVFGAVINEKPQLLVLISKELAANSGLHAGNAIRELAAAIQGGGGGQPFFATAGGKNVAGLEDAIRKAGELF